MEKFTFGLEWFIYGFAVGWVANPAWKILTRIVEEAKIARQQWHKGPEQ